MPADGVAQNFDDFGMNNGMSRNSGRMTSDSIMGQHSQVMRGISVWTVDEITGDRTEAEPDTTWYMRMNHVFASGLYGEYNTLGNNGSPRINRIFTDRSADYDDFIFTSPYSQFIVKPGDFHFTNTYCPITNIDFNTCGSKLDGEDHLKVRFAVNAGKRLGFGFKFDYLYAIGYYNNQGISHFNYSMWGSYLGDQYQAHLLLSTNSHKVSENGGITDDEYILHPESFNDSYTEAEIPVFLQRNYNRNSNKHVFFNHKYSIGFNRKVPMTEKEIEARKFAMASAEEQKAKAQEENAEQSNDYVEEKTEEQLKAEQESMWMKDEYVPVTSFFHTAKIDDYHRRYIGYNTPKSYYLNDYYNLGNDSINDVTDHLHISNSLGIALLEGFNKYMQFGLKGYATHEFKHFSLPTLERNMESWNENNLIVGGELSRRQGEALHFNLRGSFCALGTDIGQVDFNGDTELNVPLLGDTVQLAVTAGYSLLSPSSYLSKYHSRHYWWDIDNMSKESRVHLEGKLTIGRTNTVLRVCIDNIKNYAYLATSYNISDSHEQTGTTVTPRQKSGMLNVLTAQVKQNLQFGAVHWDNLFTYQVSSDKDVLPLPTINVYSGLYLRFKIAHVLDCDLGADVRYFTKYNAPEYSPQLGSFVIQENKDVRTSVGNYPIVNAFANFNLKNARFFVMMSHVNAGSGGNYFLTPHHPLNTRVLRFGVNWNFFN